MDILEWDGSISVDDWLFKSGMVTTRTYGRKALVEEYNNKLTYEDGSWHMHNTPGPLNMGWFGDSKQNSILGNTITYIPTGTNIINDSVTVTTGGNYFPNIITLTESVYNGKLEEIEKLKKELEHSNKQKEYNLNQWDRKDKENIELRQKNITQAHNIEELLKAHNALKEVLKDLPTNSDLEELCQNLSSQLVEANASKDDLITRLAESDSQVNWLHKNWIRVDDALYASVCKADKLEIELEKLKELEKLDTKFIQEDTIYVDENNVNYYIDKHLKTKQESELQSFKTKWDEMSLLEKSDYLASGATVYRSSDGAGPFRAIKEVSVVAGNQREFGIVCRNKKGKDVQVPISDLLPYNPNKAPSGWKSTVLSILSGLIFGGLVFTLNPLYAIILFIVQTVIMISLTKEIE